MKKKSVMKMVSLMSAILALTACGSQKEEKAMTSSSAKTEQSSSKTSASKTSSTQESKSETMASASMEKEAKTETGSQEQAVAQSSAQEEKAQETTAQAGGLDVNAIAAGDFSSVAGTWQNDKGETVVFSNEGLLSNRDQIVFEHSSNGRAYFSMGAAHGESTWIGLVMIPKGVEAPGGTVFDQDVLMFIQSVPDDSHPLYKIK